MNFARLIVFQARQRPFDPAVATTAGVATYSLLAKAVEVIVGRLEEQALPRGALVALSISDPVRHIASTIALALLGLRSMTIPNAYSVDQAGVAPDLFVVNSDISLEAGSRVLRMEDSWFSVDPSTPPDYHRLLSLPGFESDEDDVHLVLSSGTTGRPKCVGLNSRVIELRSARAHAMLAGAHSSAIRSMHLMGFSTIAGFQAVAMTLGYGGLIAFAQQPADVVHLIRLFQVEGLGLAIAQVPPILRHLEGQPPLTSLRLVVGAGSKLPKQLLAEMRAKLAPNVQLGYGSTEGGSVSHGTGAILEIEEGSVGYVLPWAEVEIVDAQGGIVAEGADGIIRFRSNELAHYVVDRDQGEQGFRDGWFYPGDVGRLRKDGLLAITGRVNEVINKGGVIVAPDLIDEVLKTLPGVKDAAAFGVKNVRGIEEIWAAVVTDAPPDVNAMILKAKEKLADRVPDVIVRVEAIPRNRMGKIEREKLREETVSRLRK